MVKLSKVMVILGMIIEKYNLEVWKEYFLNKVKLIWELLYYYEYELV